MPEEALHQLAGGEEEVLLGGVAGVFEGGRAFVVARGDEPLVEWRLLGGTDEIATQFDGAFVFGHVDAQLGDAVCEIEPVEDAVVLARGLEEG